MKEIATSRPRWTTPTKLRRLRRAQLRVDGLEERVVPANAIVTENLLAGTPQSNWDIGGNGDPAIQGFATDISVNHGQTVNFKIKDTASSTVPYRHLSDGLLSGQRRPPNHNNSVVSDTAASPARSID